MKSGLEGMEHSELNSAIELHDSTLGSIEQRNGHIEIALTPAYIHKSQGDPGADHGTGWVQNAVIAVESASMEGRVAELPCWLSDGDLRVADDVLLNLLPLPLDRTGPVEFTLLTVNADRVVIRGTRVRAELIGEPRYVEDYP